MLADLVARIADLGIRTEVTRPLASGWPPKATSLNTVPGRCPPDPVRGRG